MNKKLIILIIVFFIIGFLLRVNLFGISEIPTARNYDSSYHLYMSEHFSKTSYIQALENNPEFLSMNEKTPFFHPPFQYLIPSFISKLGLNPYMSYNLFLILMDSLLIIIIFLLTKLIFKNNLMAILSSLLYIIPFPSLLWFSSYDYGLFTTIISLSLLSIT
ncbi:hypothetical protein ACFL1H_04905, partial [Nanoarchaeota archaeon]